MVYSKITNCYEQAKEICEQSNVESLQILIEHFQEWYARKQKTIDELFTRYDKEANELCSDHDVWDQLERASKNGITITYLIQRNKILTT